LRAECRLIYLDEIQIKLSDVSSIESSTAKVMIDSMTSSLEAYVGLLRKRFSGELDIASEREVLCLCATRKVTQPARALTIENDVIIFEGKDLNWHKDICSLEEVNWVL
jgi:hypothetical protein